MIGCELMLKKILPVWVIVLLLFSTIPHDTEVEYSLGEQTVNNSGSAVRVQITSPVFIMSADEVVTFTAKLYDSVNSEVAGNIIWSSTNGTITNEGTFYPWNSGVITIQARHTNLTDEFNITVTPGIGPIKYAKSSIFNLLFFLFFFKIKSKK